MVWGQKRSGGGCGTWLALILAALALIVAWAAYRRTGGELGTLLQDAGIHYESSAEAGWKKDLEEARIRLLKQRPEVAGEGDLAQVRRDVAELRADLDRTYRNTSTAAKEQWKEFDADLARLQGQLEEGRAKALATLDTVLEKTRKEEEKNPGDR